MASTTKQRTVRLVNNDGHLALVIRQHDQRGEQCDAYFLTQIASGWAFSKHDGTRYHVSEEVCTCKGNRFHGHCKHREALVALKACGKL